MEVKIKEFSGSKWYSSQIELVIKTEETTIIKDLIPWNSDKVNDEFINQLENVIQKLKNHNQCVDEYNALYKK